MGFWEFSFYLFVYASILTYLALGIIIAIESLLALYNVQSAIDWIREWHKASTYKTMLILFLPMIQIFYFFLEFLPHLFKKEPRQPLNLDIIYFNAFGEI